MNLKRGRKSERGIQFIIVFAVNGSDMAWKVFVAIV